MNTSVSKLRKLVALFSVATLLASLLVVPAFAGVPAQYSWAEDAAMAYGDADKFGELGNTLNKCEFSKVVATALGLEETMPTPYPFADVADWAKGYVGALYAEKIVEGRTATFFGCSEPVTRAEMVVMLSRAYDWSAVAAATLTPAQEAEFAGAAWAKEAFAKALTAGVVKGYADGTLKPGQTANKAEGFTVAYRAAGEPEVEGGETPRDNGPLQGGAGEIQTVTETSSGTFDEVQEGEEDVQVLGLEVEADGSDIELTSLRLVLTPAGTGGASDDLEDYIESVSIMFDGEVVGTADADEFSEDDGEYSKSVSLEDTVVRDGDEEKLYVALTAIGNMDSADMINDAVNVAVTQIRYEDATGALFSETGVGLPVDEDVDFEDLTTSGDLEFKVGKGSENPDEAVVEVAESSDTEVTMLEFTLRVKGADMVVDELSVLAEPSAAASLVGMVDEFRLVLDGEEIDSVSPTETTAGANEYITFTDLEDDLDEQVLAEDETVTLQVVALINGTDDTGDFANGDSLTVSLNAEARDADDAVDGDEVADGFDANGSDTALVDAYGIDLEADGKTVEDTDRTGTATGETQTFYEEGISATFVSATETVTSVDGTDNDYVTFKIKYDVTAVGNDFYVSDASVDIAEGTLYNVVTGAGTAAGYSQSLSAAGSETGDSEGDVYFVEEGTTRQFTLTVTASAATDGTPADDNTGYYQVVLDSIMYDTDATTTVAYTSGLDKFKTDAAYLAE